MTEALTETLNNMQHYLDVNDVAELLNLEPETIYRYCKEDFMPYFKIGRNSLRFDPRQLAVWVQSHQFSAGGNVPDKITDWVVTHVLDRTLKLPIPEQLRKVIAGLPKDWRLNALSAAVEDCDLTGYSEPLQTFKEELKRQLTVAQQRHLLAELLWLGVNYA